MRLPRVRLWGLMLLVAVVAVALKLAAWQWRAEVFRRLAAEQAGLAADERAMIDEAISSGPNSFDGVTAADRDANYTTYIYQHTYEAAYREDWSEVLTDCARQPWRTPPEVLP